MTDFTRLRSSRSSHDDCAFFAANEYSQGGASPIPAIPESVMTTETPTPSPDIVNFYDMIDQTRGATTIQLRSRINELYAEAQVNRDHRNAQKRQHYTRLLHWIPPLRSILLHEGKRAKYDNFLDNPQSAAGGDFQSFLNDLLGENDFNFGEGESILGISDTARSDTARSDTARSEASQTEAGRSEVPRLSSRLDAVAAAAGQGAVRASATAREIGVETRTADKTANKNIRESVPVVPSQNSVSSPAMSTPLVASASSRRNKPEETSKNVAISQKASEIIARSTIAPDDIPSGAAPTTASSSETVAPQTLTPRMIATKVVAPDATSPKVVTPQEVAQQAITSKVIAPKVIAPKVGTSSTRSPRPAARRQFAPHPDLMRERASLTASAFGVIVLFAVLLLLRAIMGVDSNLAALTGIALVSGFVAWRALRRILMSRLPR